MPRPETIQLWRQRLERFNPAEMTVGQFCQSEGVSQPAFYKWKKTLRELDQSSTSQNSQAPGLQKTARFLPLSLADVQPRQSDRDEPGHPQDRGRLAEPIITPTASTTIELPGGVRIVVEVQS